MHINKYRLLFIVLSFVFVILFFFIGHWIANFESTMYRDYDWKDVGGWIGAFVGCCLIALIYWSFHKFHFLKKPSISIFNDKEFDLLRSYGVTRRAGFSDRDSQ
jgi:hypothetical protein